MVSNPTPARLPAAVDLSVFRHMADLSNEGFWLVDRRGRFLYVNAQAVAQMGGYTREELLELTVADISPDLTPEDFAANVEALAHGPLPLIESWTRRKDGTFFQVEVSTARVEVAGDVYLFGVARDITERKAAEAVRTNLAADLLRTLESERQRVARELHDDVGQALATIGVLLDALDVTPSVVPQSARPALDSARRTITQITESLARIVREYHPAELLGLGLEDTLQAHTRQFAERHKMEVRLSTIPVEELLTPDQELHVYRVVQEAIANAARHSGAEQVDVAITRTDDRVIVAVRDSGCGFDADSARGHGVGLVTMRERATLMRAELAVESAPGAGTMVRLAIPLPPASPLDAPARTTTRATEPSMRRATARKNLPRADAAASVPLPAALDLELFRRMVDMSSEAFMLTDHDGRFVYVNERAESLTGFRREELLAMTVSDINFDYPPAVWREWAAAAKGPMPPFETRNWRKDGSIVPVEISAARIDTGGESYFSAVVRDISAYRETEAAQKSFTRRLLHTLEAERRRVARDLHDEVGQAIATVGVLLHALENAPGSIPADLHPGLSDTHATIRQITESVAGIVRDYHPAELLGLGLEDTLRTHARDFAHRHRLRLRIAACSVEGLLSDEHALHVYRIVQEALANVARHAHARTVSVRLTRRKSRVVVSVRDDGVGFDSGSVRAGGFGLVTMRERATLIGAVLEVRSRQSHGTEVRLAMPIDTHQSPAPADD